MFDQRTKHKTLVDYEITLVNFKPSANVLADKCFLVVGCIAKHLYDYLVR